MKAISEWFWVIASIIAGLIIFSIVRYNTIQMNIINEEQRSLSQFDEMKGIINDLCLSFSGNVRTYTLTLSETIDGIYASKDKHTEFNKDELVKKILNEELSQGRFLCIKVRNQRLRCDELYCNTSFIYVGSVPEEFSLSALTNRLMGRSPVFIYDLILSKTEEEVYVTKEKVPPLPPQPSPPKPQPPPPVPPPPKACTPESLINLVNVEEAMKNINYLTQKSRSCGSSWNSETADYIKKALESYGLNNVYFEDFNYVRNIVGEIGSGNNVIIVTGGHRDSVSNCPGAVDNAAGTSVVMESARVLATCKDEIKNYKIRFVLFDCEERSSLSPGLLGSSVYVNTHKNENIKRMLNFDCLGLKDSPGLTIFRTAIDLSNSADKACNYLGLNCMKMGQAPCASDHCPFDENGIPYLFAINYGFTCGPCYHCMSCMDDISQIDKTRMEWALKFAVYVLADLYLK
ncbi:MAG: M28 family peptidase [Candidatus Aenigmatarchaeota archaeon]